MIRLLYLQHAGELGGSSMSLLYTMQGMRDLGHTCIVALARPSEALSRLYTSAGFETITWPGLSLWDHSTVAPRPTWDPRTWWMLANLAANWRGTARATRELIALVRPDLVHLNSMPFVPSAHALIHAGIAFVWHVREPPPDNGLRTRVIRHVMRRAPRLIFISEFDRQQWVGGASAEVIQNFVDLEQFRPDVDGRPVRAMNRIPDDAKVILYLGGVSEVKGFFVLLDALRLLRAQGDRFVCMMPGTDLEGARSWKGRIGGMVLPLVGSGTPRQKARKRLTRFELWDNVRALPFAADVVSFFAAADVVVFPATKPHFARPVIESIAMRRPAVGSDIAGVRELLAVHPLGRVTPAGDSAALAAAIHGAMNGKSDAAVEDARFDRARKLFDRRAGVAAIEAVYRTLLRDSRD